MGADVGRDGRRCAINVQLLVQLVLIPQAADERSVFGNLCYVRTSTCPISVTRRANNERQTDESDSFGQKRRKRRPVPIIRERRGAVGGGGGGRKNKEYIHQVEKEKDSKIKKENQKQRK